MTTDKEKLEGALELLLSAQKKIKEIKEEVSLLSKTHPLYSYSFWHPDDPESNYLTGESATAIVEMKDCLWDIEYEIKKVKYVIAYPKEEINIVGLCIKKAFDVANYYILISHILTFYYQRPFPTFISQETEKDILERQNKQLSYKKGMEKMRKECESGALKAKEYVERLCSRVYYQDGNKIFSINIHQEK